ELMYEVIFNSSLQSSIFNPRLTSNLPVGFEVDRVEVEYPRYSENWETIAHNINGGLMEVDAYTHSAMIYDSLPGTLANNNVNPRQMAVRIYGYAGCDFRSGSRLVFTALGEKSCGGPAQGSGSVRGTDRLIIEGLEPYVVDPVIEIDATEGITCSVATPVEVMYKIEGGDFEGTDSAVLVLSPGIELVEGSLVCLSGESDF